MIILPSGRSEIGLIQMKDYGIISYLGRGEEKKIGELVLWALEQSDNKKILNYSEEKIEKMYSNASSYSKFTRTYNAIGFSLDKGKYKLRLSAKDGAGYSEFRDEKGKMYEVEFNEKPSALELGTKIMEMFEFKEKYDGDFEQDVLFNLNITITVVKKDKWTKNLLKGKETVKSMIEQVYAVKIPAGTTIYTGPVGYQGGMYFGGLETNQIFLLDTRIPGVEFFKYSK